MKVTALERETVPELDPAEHQAAGLAIQRCPLLNSYDQVLRLIAQDAGLSECLKVIAFALKELHGGAHCLIVALEPESQNIVGSAATAPALATLLTTLTARGDAGESALMEELRSAGLTLASRHLIENHARQALGCFVIMGDLPASLQPVDPAALDSLKLLTGYAIDSTRRTQALLSANERFAALAKNIPGVVYQRVVRPNGDIRYSYISEAAKDLFGVSPEEILSNPQALFDCHGPDYYATFHDRLLAASRKMQLWDVEATIITRDGTRKFTHAIARPHKESDGSVVWNGVILDQTRIKEAELEAAAAGVLTRDAIIESIPQAFALYDRDDRLVTWNTRFLEIYPELAEAIAPGTHYETLLRLEIEAGIDPGPEEAKLDDHVAQRLDRHRASGQVLERRLPNGRWILINEHRTGDGGVVVLHTDITDLKDRESALARSNRELEAFASIASHDLQEPLRKVEAFGDRLKRKYEPELGDDGKMYIDRMQSAVSRMRALINDLLDYSRVTTKGKPFEAVDLTEILRDVVSDLEVRIEEVRGEVTYDRLPVIDADRTQLRQLFQNLIANALKFHRQDERPRVVIRTETVDAGRHGNQRCCRIDVADNGIGFEMKYADRIFGIFQRLHSRAEFEGTGIGLATCRKIIERHDGEIRVASVCGQGTTFTIDLPLRQPKVRH
ncbi:MAG: PAS domain-containing protein [Rhizobiales bacterium]|nr:PAS domain-containing protein [Hyphomicrobiales bacterium]